MSVFLFFNVYCLFIFLLYDVTFLLHCQFQTEINKPNNKPKVCLQNGFMYGINKPNNQCMY